MSETLAEEFRRLSLMHQAARDSADGPMKLYRQGEGNGYASAFMYAATKIEAVSDTTRPDEVLNVNARMKLPQMPVEINEAQRPIADWLKSRGFIEDRYVFGYCWSDRDGLGYTDLEFYPWGNDRYPSRYSAIIGHHASGENPRTIIGTCDTLEEVQMVCETIRLINGFNKPESWEERTQPLAAAAKEPTP